MIETEEHNNQQVARNVAKVPFEPMQMKVIDVKVDKGYALSTPPPRAKEGQFEADSFNQNDAW